MNAIADEKLIDAVKVSAETAFPVVLNVETRDASVAEIQVEDSFKFFENKFGNVSVQKTRYEPEKLAMVRFKGTINNKNFHVVLMHVID
jgi:hypothetical protein